MSYSPTKRLMTSSSRSRDTNLTLSSVYKPHSPNKMENLRTRNTTLLSPYTRKDTLPTLESFYKKPRPLKTLRTIEHTYYDRTNDQTISKYHERKGRSLQVRVNTSIDQACPDEIEIRTESTVTMRLRTEGADLRSIERKRPRIITDPTSIVSKTEVYVEKFLLESTKRSSLDNSGEIELKSIFHPIRTSSRRPFKMNKSVRESPKKPEKPLNLNKVEILVNDIERYNPRNKKVLTSTKNNSPTYRIKKLHQLANRPQMPNIRENLDYSLNRGLLKHRNLLKPEKKSNLDLDTCYDICGGNKPRELAGSRIGRDIGVYLVTD